MLTLLTPCRVPVVALFIVLIILHRRNKRKLAEEDAKDKYRSLDFGIESGVGGKKGKNQAKKEDDLDRALAELSLKSAILLFYNPQIPYSPLDTRTLLSQTLHLPKLLLQHWPRHFKTFVFSYHCNQSSSMQTLR